MPGSNLPVAGHAKAWIGLAGVPEDFARQGKALGAWAFICLEVVCFPSQKELFSKRGEQYLSLSTVLVEMMMVGDTAAQLL